MRSHLSFPGRWWLCNPCLGQQGRCRGEVFLRSRSLRSLDMCRSFCDRVGWAMRKCGNPEESKTDSDKNQKRISVTKSDVEHLLDTPAHDPNFSCTRSSMRRRPSCWMGATGAKFDPQRFGDTSTRNVTKNTIEHTLYMCFGEQTYIQRSSTFLAGKEVAPTAVFDLVLNEWLDLQLVSPLVSPSAACHNVVSRVAHDSHHTYHTCHTCHTCLPWCPLWCRCDVSVQWTLWESVEVGRSWLEVEVPQMISEHLASTPMPRLCKISGYCHCSRFHVVQNCKKLINAIDRNRS